MTANDIDFIRPFVERYPTATNKYQMDLALRIAEFAPALLAELDKLREQAYAQKPVIEKALTWLEERETDPNVTPVADLIDAEDALHDAIEQYRVMDLALTTARAEQPEVAR